MRSSRNVPPIVGMARVFALALLLMLSPGAAGESRWGISISSPANGEMVYDNQGNVAVTVAIEGTGKTPAIRLVLDGARYTPARDASPFLLENIDRGEHTLEAQIVDSEGRVIAVSQPVTFYVWRASALFPGRKK